MAETTKRNRGGFSLTERHGSLPRLPYKKISQTILGTHYNLSVASITPDEAQSANKKYRKKSYVPDALAFPLAKDEGEIILNTEALSREAKSREMTLRTYTAYIFIHACLHLDGFKHGTEMTRKENFFMKKLGLSRT
jgi:probable rRNA maturation factor